MKLVVHLGAPVPMGPYDGAIKVARIALLEITYPLVALARPLPGSAFVSIRMPAHDVFHPNIFVDHDQRMCLGDTLPSRIPVTELILLSYCALQMTTAMIDEKDASLVANCEAAKFYQHNPQLMPLSTTPFLEPDEFCTPGDTEDHNDLVKHNR